MTDAEREAAIRRDLPVSDTPIWESNSAFLLRRLDARDAVIEKLRQSVGHPADDAATVNYLEIVRLRGLLADASERIAALEVAVAAARALRDKIPDVLEFDVIVLQPSKPEFAALFAALAKAPPR